MKYLISIILLIFRVIIYVRYLKMESGRKRGQYDPEKYFFDNFGPKLKNFFPLIVWGQNF